MLCIYFGWCCILSCVSLALCAGSLVFWYFRLIVRTLWRSVAIDLFHHGADFENLIFLGIALFAACIMTFSTVIAVSVIVDVFSEVI